MQIGFFSNCNRTHTQTVQAKPPKKTEKFHEFSTLGRERASRCSVDSRGSCTGALVVAVVATNYSASVARPHRLVQLLLHDLRLIGNLSAHRPARLHTVSTRESFLSPQANFTCESRRVVRNLYPVTEQIWLNSPLFDAVLGSSLQVSNLPATSPAASHRKYRNSGTRAPLLRMFALRCILRHKGHSGNPPGGSLASHVCTNLRLYCLLCLFNNQVVPQRRPNSSFVATSSTRSALSGSIPYDGIHNHL